MPEFIEIFISEDGIVVKEWIDDDKGEGCWKIAGGGIDEEAEPPKGKKKKEKVKEENVTPQTPER